MVEAWTVVDGKRQVLLAADTDKVAVRILILLEPVPLEVVGVSGGCADEGTLVLSVMVPLILLPLEMCLGCVDGGALGLDGAKENMKC